MIHIINIKILAKEFEVAVLSNKINIIIKNYNFIYWSVFWFLIYSYVLLNGPQADYKFYYQCQSCSCLAYSFAVFNLHVVRSYIWPVQSDDLLVLAQRPDSPISVSPPQHV